MSDDAVESPEWERFERDENGFIEAVLAPMCRSAFDEAPYNPAELAYRHMMQSVFAMSWFIRESGAQGDEFAETFRDMVVGGAALVLHYFQHPELYGADFVDLLSGVKKSSAGA